MITIRQRVLITGAGYLLILIACLIGGYFVYVARTNAQLLRTDGDTLPSNPGLVRFAAGEAAPIFARHCASCHGADLRGNPALGAPNLTDQDWIYGQGRIGEIEQTITYGIRSHNPRSRNLSDMPGFGKAKPDERLTLNSLTPPQIDDLVSYLLVLEGRASKRPAASRGADLFLGAGGCFDCHGNDAIGDNYVGAVNLTDNIWLYGDGSAASIFRSIAKGHAGLCPAWMNKIQPASIKALAVFIYERSHAAQSKTTGGAS